VATALAAAAAVVAVLIVSRPSRPAPVALAVYVGAPGEVRSVESGGAVAANAALHFQVRPAPGCHLWILSLDARGQINRLYPPKGEQQGGAVVEQAGTIPGGAVLDGNRGPERIFAVCCPDPVEWKKIAERAASAFAGGAEGVRRAREIPGLPQGSTQATVLLEKT
jgi:hypothetical protein